MNDEGRPSERPTANIAAENARALGPELVIAEANEIFRKAA
jgi:hypothetical protein